MSGAVVKGEFTFRFHRPDGSVYRRVRVPNGVTLECMNYLLATAFKGGSPKTSAFGVQIILNSTFGGVYYGDTYASHPTWTAFTGGPRTILQVDTPGAASAKVQFQRLSLGDYFTVPEGTEMRGAALLAGLTPPSLTPGPSYNPQVVPNSGTILVATSVYYGDPFLGYPPPYGLPIFATPDYSAPPGSPVHVSVGYVIQGKPA